MNFLQSVFGSKQPGTVEQGGTAPGSGNVSGGASRQAYHTLLHDSLSGQGPTFPAEAGLMVTSPLASPSCEASAPPWRTSTPHRCRAGPCQWAALHTHGYGGDLQRCVAVPEAPRGWLWHHRPVWRVRWCAPWLAVLLTAQLLALMVHCWQVMAALALLTLCGRIFFSDC